MPTAADLIADPTGFMRENLLIVIGPQGIAGGEQAFVFKRSRNYQGVNLLDRDRLMEVYSLLPSGSGAEGEPLTAWWCPYKPDQALGTTLPGAGGAHMMFTAAMNGCTFAVGSVNPDGDVRVHHVNAMSAHNALGKDATPEQRGELQRQVQRDIARRLVDDARLIDPDDYYVPQNAIVPVPHGVNITTVTFGRRSARSGWKFYTHQYFTHPNDRYTLKFMGTKRVI